MQALLRVNYKPRFHVSAEEIPARTSVFDAKGPAGGFLPSQTSG